MDVEAIKEAIQQLPEDARRELVDWFEEQFLFPEDSERTHEEIGLGLAQLDRGEGISGDASRAGLQDKKAPWLSQRPRRR